MSSIRYLFSSSTLVVHMTNAKVEIQCFRIWERSGQACSLSTRLLTALFLSLLLPGCANEVFEQKIIIGKHQSFEDLLAIYPDLNLISDIIYRIDGEVADPRPFRKQLDLFAKVFGLTQQEYINQVSPESLISGAVSAAGKIEKEATNGQFQSQKEAMSIIIQDMISSLDAHSAYLPPDVYDQMQARTRGRFGGLGIQMKIEKGLIKCIAVIEGTPAHRAGIEPGDYISHVDGSPVSGWTLVNAVQKLRGPPGSTILIKVMRGNTSKSFDTRIMREIINIESVKSSLEGDIGYIQISAFTESTYESLRESVKSLSSASNNRLEGLILDLRNNPGGLLDQALKVSDAFLMEGSIVSTIGRDVSKVRKFSADSRDIALGVPIAVLINAGSASASEIVSGALRDHDRAVVLGERSFGKGSVQTVIPLGKGHGALRLTTALYYTPSGESIQVHGIEPDILFKDIGTKMRESSLDNYLSPISPAPSNTPSLLLQQCPDASDDVDPVLACAVTTLENSDLWTGKEVGEYDVEQ